jgi:uncharacterized LabA/DUF88 family protein
MPNTTLHLGRYQPRDLVCKICGRTYSSYVEKGTDVAAAVMLVDCAIRKRSDVVFLLAGDNDYLPAVKFARTEGARLVVGFVVNPHRSEHDQLMAVADLRHNCERYIKIDAAFMSDCWRPVPYKGR